MPSLERRHRGLEAIKRDKNELLGERRRCTPNHVVSAKIPSQAASRLVSQPKKFYEAPGFHRRCAYGLGAGWLRSQPFVANLLRDALTQNLTPTMSLISLARIV